MIVHIKWNPMFFVIYKLTLVIKVCLFLDSCHSVTCPTNMKCRIKKDRPKCVCKPKCSRRERKRGPVCGTDMIKYKNYCHLLRYNCRYNTEIKVDYYGKCKGMILQWNVSKSSLLGINFCVKVMVFAPLSKLFQLYRGGQF